MMSCPKCNGYRISGPAYFRDALGRERLKYTCARCGFSCSEPTADAHENNADDLRLMFPPQPH